MQFGETQPDIDLVIPPDRPAIAAAARDVARDLQATLRHEPEVRVRTDRASDAGLAVTIDPTMGTESWRLKIDEQRIELRAGDDLGAIFGLYRFAETFLGVDPFWFWKDHPRGGTTRDRLDLPPQTLESSPAAFRYRGWFVNDEDLLTGWKDGGGERDLDYPYYGQVVHPDVIDRVLETLLRCGGNLVIPASFVDVMNPDEARLVRQVIDRGLYITQHHIEPLGVSHFGFETYWRRRGVEAKHSYVREPDRVRQTWRAYAEKWHELAGDRLIWQLGLRGRGDTPVWNSDDVDPAEAGKLISDALADQASIVRQVDGRSDPPMTLTGFLEMSDLLHRRQVRLPDEAALIFSDHGYTQQMQADFHDLPRDPGREHGVYYHAAFWSHGPHLCQGNPPWHAAGQLKAVQDRGDTWYAILNVSNVREHVSAIATLMQQLRDGAATPVEAWEAHVPEGTAGLVRRYFDAMPFYRAGERVQDGDALVLTKRAVGRLRDGQPIEPHDFDDDEAFAVALVDAARQLSAVAEDAEVLDVPALDRAWHEFLLVHQPRLLASMYRVLSALLRNDPSGAADHIDALLALLPDGERGRFAHWYRGEVKANWKAVRCSLADVTPAPAIDHA